MLSNLLYTSPVSYIYMVLSLALNVEQIVVQKDHVKRYRECCDLNIVTINRRLLKFLMIHRTSEEASCCRIQLNRDMNLGCESMLRLRTRQATCVNTMGSKLLDLAVHSLSQKSLIPQMSAQFCKLPIFQSLAAITALSVSTTIPRLPTFTAPQSSSIP